MKACLRLEGSTMKINVNFPSKSVPAWTQNNLALVLKASSLTVAVVALYIQDLRLIFMNALTDEATSYILIIPFLFAYLVYRKRRMLRAVTSDQGENRSGNTKYLDMIGGILLCTTAFLLYWYGSYTFTPLEYHVLTLPLFAAGLTLVIFGSHTLRQACFPIVFLALLIPLPSQVIYNFGSTLSVASSEASNRIVNLLGVHSTISSLSGTPAITITQANGTVLPPFAVDIACSGIYSLMGFFVFAAFVAFIVRDKLWRKAATFLVGFPLIYVFNIVRITSILLIGYQWGEQLALNVFHTLSGWVLIFIGTLILMLISEKLLRTQMFTKQQPKSSCSTCNSDLLNVTESFCFTCGRMIRYPKTKLKKTVVAKIVTIGAIIILLISIQVPVFALTQGPAQVLIQTPTGQQGNSQIFPQLPNCTLQYLYRNTEFENFSGQELSLIYAYTPDNPEDSTIYVGFEMAHAPGHLHPWEFCLITHALDLGYQPSVDQLDLRDVQILQNPSIIARYFAFRDKSTDQIEVVLYWYENSIFEANGTSQEKYVKISLIGYPDGTQNVTGMENKLLPFATAIANYWQPIKTWTQIAIFLSRNAFTLAEVTSIMLAATVVFYTFENLKQKRANAAAYEKLSSNDKNVIDSVAETEKTTNPTLQAIAKTFSGKTGQQMNEGDLLLRLSGTEKAGIIRGTIASVQDEPTYVWKTSIAKKKTGEHKRLSAWKQIITRGLK
jgi:exosortase/archaeosortase family protein